MYAYEGKTEGRSISGEKGGGDGKYRASHCGSPRAKADKRLRSVERRKTGSRKRKWSDNTAHGGYQICICLTIYNTFPFFKYRYISIQKLCVHLKKGVYNHLEWNY